MRQVMIFVLAGLVCGQVVFGGRGGGEIAERHLMNGDLTGGQIALKQRLNESPGDDAARFGLGVTQFFAGVERVCQALHGYGLGSGMAKTDELPFFRLPMPVNESPAEVSYEGINRLVEGFLRDLEVAELTLSQIRDEDVRFALRVGLVRLDLDGDRVASEDETLWSLYADHTMRTTVNEDSARGFIVNLDMGDVHWLRGYCHLLAAGCELWLAHDWRRLFETTGHLLFPKVKTRFPFLMGDRKLARQGNVEVMDVVAVLHLMSAQVKDRERMASALEHLQAMTDQSMLSWRSIINEKDNDHEWIPSATQESVVPTIKVTVEMIAAWEELMRECRQILGGTKLMPFWRGDKGDGLGVNVRKAFMESNGFDLILWFQGSGMAPFLEEGKPVSDVSFERLQRVYNGRFVPYAVLF